MYLTTSNIRDSPHVHNVTCIVNTFIIFTVHLLNITYFHISDNLLEQSSKSTAFSFNVSFHIDLLSLVHFEDEAKITRVLSKRERLTRILSQGS